MSWLLDYRVVWRGGEIVSGGIRNDGEGPTEVSVYLFTTNPIDRLRLPMIWRIAEAFLAIEMIGIEHSELVL
ncbi:MAG: hypothetical protein ACI8P0_003829 [Planctomycetaceae bacterium]